MELNYEELMKVARGNPEFIEKLVRVSHLSDVNGNHHQPFATSNISVGTVVIDFANLVHNSRLSP